MYGRWKKRYPYVKAMRADFRRSQKIIVSTLCLQNLAMRWGEPDMAGESSSEDEGPHDPDLRGAAHEVHRLAGKRIRDKMAQRRYDQLHN